MSLPLVSAARSPALAADSHSVLPAAGLTRRRWMARGCACAGSALFGTLTAAPAQAEGITEVLQRSHQQRLDQLRASPVTGRRHALLQADFSTLMEWHAPRSTAWPLPPEFLVALTPVLAETLLGQVVVVNPNMATAPPQERLFFIAHELGHVMLGHWQALQQMYRVHLPGELSPQAARQAARGIDFDATVLAHQQEYDADAYALQLLRQNSLGLVAATEALLRFPTIGDSPTHPSTRKRLARLHIDSPEAAAELQALQNTGEASINRNPNLRP